MKKPSALFICGTVTFTLIAVGYLVGYTSLSEQAQNLTLLKAKTQIIFNSQTKLYEDLGKLDITLEELKTANRREIKGILSKVSGISDEIQNWRNEYTAFLDNIKKGIDDLTSVDLGEVEVGKTKEKEKKEK